jgi:hypothetical protein
VIERIVLFCFCFFGFPSWFMRTLLWYKKDESDGGSFNRLSLLLGGIGPAVLGGYGGGGAMWWCSDDPHER